MVERKLLNFEPRLLRKAAVNIGKGIADLSLDLSFWAVTGALELPLVVKISESTSPEVALLAHAGVGLPFSIVSVVQGRRFMDRYLHIPSKFGFFRSNL